MNVGYAKNEVLFYTSLFVKKELNICGSGNALFEFSPVIQMLEGGQIQTAALNSKVYTIDETFSEFKYWPGEPVDVIKILIDSQAK